MDSVLQYSLKGWDGLGKAPTEVSSGSSGSAPLSNSAVTSTELSSGSHGSAPLSNSAVARCPVELWLKILHFTVEFPQRNRAPEYRGGFTPHGQISHYQLPYEGRCEVFRLPFGHDLSAARATGRDLIRVCRSWRQVVVPILLGWVTFRDDEQPSAKLLQKLSRSICQRPAGTWVRRLDIYLDSNVEPGEGPLDDGLHRWSIADLNRALEMCPQLEDFEWDGHCNFPDALKLMKHAGTTLRSITIPTSQVGTIKPSYAITDFLTGCPRLASLELPAAKFYSPWNKGHLRRIRAVRYPLRNLAFFWSPDNTHFSDFLATLKLAELCDLFLRYDGGAAAMLSATMPFFRSVGPTLLSLALSPKFRKAIDINLFVILDLCPNLQDFVADVPDVPITYLGPHQSLRRIGFNEFFLTYTDNPNNGMQASQSFAQLTSSLVAAICSAELPRLAVIRSFSHFVGVVDMYQSAFPLLVEETRKLGAEVVGHCKRRGIRFEDHLGQEVTMTSRQGESGLKIYFAKEFQILHPTTEDPESL